VGAGLPAPGHIATSSPRWSVRPLPRF
jgi:hypothetical protein